MYEEQTKVVYDYLIEKINSLEVHDYPFFHTFTDDFFPIEFYRKLNKYFPDYQDIGFGQQSKYKPNRFVKDIFNLQTKATNQNAIETQTVLANVFDRNLAETILKKFNISHAGPLGWHCAYAWDFPAESTQALVPHLDYKAKIISMVVYLPLIETPIRVINKQLQYFKIPGTDLLIQNEDKSFTKVREIQAWCNRMTAFRKDDRSWHAVEETKHPRRTLTFFIIDPKLCEEHALPERRLV